ncbi:MAG: aspartate--ammonia ligase, partial [Victivallales bacterium]|nr:aspartate--ammonia ligase [Victivallales bacterium]
HAEIVHSLAKWKRMKLSWLKMQPGFGIYTDMNAIRADEDLDNIHSLYVDQWDWEKVIDRSTRNLDYLKDCVRRIYYAIRRTEAAVCNDYDQLKPFLPEKITFIHSEDLEAEYPDFTPKQREHAAAFKYGAVFIIGIGGKLPITNEKHDGRAPDYDDWTTPSDEKHKGLNGDILVYNPVLETSFELSSMGIRVDKDAMLRQLQLCNAMERTSCQFHKALLDGELPLTIGGGIGQSRLCMLLLQKAHIGEIQASIWPEAMRAECSRHNIPLL